MGEKVKITYEGQPCRKCQTPVVKKSHDGPTNPKAKYWFRYCFYCPECKTIYVVPSERVVSTPSLAREKNVDLKNKRTEQELERDVDQILEKARKNFGKKTKNKRVDYHQYINSLEWINKSEQAKKRAEYRCQVCNRSNSEVVLHTHHRTYERLGNEKDQDLTVLCQVCHQIFHENRRLESQKNKPAPYIDRVLRQWENKRQNVEI
jgi:5-methylcytosine-specific restriction endonuclease McrA